MWRDGEGKRGSAQITWICGVSTIIGAKTAGPVCRPASA
jgi:hypothetical protein